MRRRCSLGAVSVLGLFGAAYLACALGACLSGDVVDLGSDFDAEASAPDSGSTRPPREAGAVRDGSAADRPDSATVADATDAMEEAGPRAAVCLTDPSFESHLPGDAQVNQPIQSSPPGWTVCPGGGTAATSSCALRPTDQNSYVGLSVGLAPFLNDPGSIDTPLCEPLEVGVTYSLSVDYGLDTVLADSGGAGEPPSLQIWGSTTLCAKQELLWESGSLLNACTWMTSCKSFTPSAPDTHLILVPGTSSSSAFSLTPTYVTVDNLVPSLSCP